MQLTVSPQSQLENSDKLTSGKKMVVHGGSKEILRDKTMDM
jgi:hypothetical protein